MNSVEVVESLNAQWPPSVKTVGGQATGYDPETKTLSMSFEAKPMFCHSVDIVQGGYITGMLDAAMAYTVIGPSLVPSAEEVAGCREGHRWHTEPCRDDWSGVCTAGSVTAAGDSSAAAGRKAVATAVKNCVDASDGIPHRRWVSVPPPSNVLVVLPTLPMHAVITHCH